MFRKIEIVAYIGSKSRCRRGYLRLAARFTETGCSEPHLKSRLQFTMIRALLASWVGRFACCLGVKSRPRKFERVDKWSFCLKAAMIAANRRDHEQTTAPEPQPGFQGEGGACRGQGRPDDSSTGRALRRPPQSGDGLESSARGRGF